MPKRGDAIWIDCDLQVGNEQSGRRPAIVLSPVSYNRRTNLLVCCPVTSRVKGYPFEFELPGGLPVSGVALADQIRSVDWLGRRATFICELPEQVLRDTLDAVASQLYIDPDDPATL